MQFIPLPGVALLIPTPIERDPDLHHLHFLLTGARSSQARDKNVIVVSVTSVKPGRRIDSACLLNKGDHANIHHPSFVSYQSASAVSIGHIQSCLEKRMFFQRDTLDELVLQRVLDGAHISNHTPRWVKNSLGHI